MRMPNLLCSIIMILSDLGMIIPCFYYTCSLDWKPKDQRPFMVLLPREALSMPEFTDVLGRYRGKIIRLTWGEAAVVPLFLFLDEIGQILLITAVIFSYLMIPPYFGRKARAELLTLKKEKGWITQYTAVHRADMRLGKKDIKKWPYIVLFLFAAVLPVICSCFTVFYLKRLPLFSSMAGMGILELIILIAAFWQHRKYRTWKKEVLYPDDFYSGDEDDYWFMGRFGLYYDNPYDPAVMKNNNSGGLNMNLNRARLGSWIFWLIVWGVAVIPLAYYLVYPQYVDWSGQLADVRLNRDENILEVEGKFYHAEIPLEALDSVELINSIDELGDGVRTQGTGTFAYGKGRFRYEKTGPVISYTAYRHPPFLLVTVGNGEDETTYLLNDDDPEITKTVYEELADRAAE
ncbi:MAG: hypothetical protein Q4D16_07260 [Eubacteriales bacterium]|nr:hypothetical protein [Eubacteriales bacterium]